MMKATWLAPFALALAVTPALADDMDTDNDQMQDGQMQQGTTAENAHSDLSNGDTDDRMTRQDDDMDTDNGDMDTDDDMDTDTDTDTDS